ncbi:hypothetical protein FQZ97_837190 [compost metagenome]
MVRGQHHVRRGKPGRGQLALLRHAHVPGEQQRMARALHAQHAAVRVAVFHRPAAVARRMQEREHHAIHLPLAPAPASLHVARRSRAGRVRPHAGVAPQERFQVERGMAAQHRHRRQHRAGAADVVRVGVREDQHVQLPDAARLQKGRDHPLARIAAAVVARTGVEQQGLAGRLHQDGAALPHIQGAHAPVARLRPVGTPEQQRQHACPAPLPPRPSARLQRPGHARHRKGQPGPRRRRDRKAGPFGIAHPGDRRHGQVEGMQPRPSRERRQGARARRHRQGRAQ